MSPHDEATLSAAERAALAGLESKAEADDPRLAAALKGGIRRAWHPAGFVPAMRIPSVVVRAARTWLGPLLAVAGLVVMVLAVSSLTLLAAGGALLFVAGALLSTEFVRSGARLMGRVVPGDSSGRRRDDNPPTDL